ncbi:hypothetical protein [Ancylobacter terrae]|uniref:hypothetical protein n=1 Tax=Ancylobacter sp. sgz301288 TaxID=3342077 RepID=UPI00385C1B01
MSHKQVVIAGELRGSEGRRARRALMEAAVVGVLTCAIVAVLFLLGLDRASAAPIDAATMGTDGRVAVGAVLLAVFAGLCVLSSFMLRDTLKPSARRRRVTGRGGRMG